MRGDLLGGLAVAPSSLPRRRRRHHHHSPPDDGDAQPLPPMLPLLHMKARLRLLSSVAKTSVRAVYGLHEPSARDEYKIVESI